jgi:hypothetical protein
VPTTKNVIIASNGGDVSTIMAVSYALEQFELRTELVHDDAEKVAARTSTPNSRSLLQQLIRERRLPLEVWAVFAASAVSLFMLAHHCSPLLLLEHAILTAFLVVCFDSSLRVLLRCFAVG